MAVASSQPDVIQSQIKAAVRSRIDDFRDQSKSLTFQNVRRLLEQDLGLEPLTLDLDFHRSFIKEFLAKCLNGTGADSNVSMTSKPTKGDQLKEEVKKPKDSPDLGLVSEHKASESGSNKNELVEIIEVSVGELKKAIRKIAPYVQANLPTTTVAVLLRLLEKDMKLDEHDLDRFKKRITDQLQIYLQRMSRKAECSQSTASSNSSSKQISDSPKHDNGVKDEEDWDKEEDMEISEEKELSGSKNDPKKNHENSAIVYKRKRPDNETNGLSEKRIRVAEKVADNGIDAEETRMVSEGDQILSSSAMKAALFEVTNAKETAEEAKRQAEKAKEEAVIAKEEAEIAKEEVKKVMEVAEKSITTLKSKYVASLRQKKEELRQKKEELKTAKELAEEAQRQTEEAKEEAKRVKEEVSKYETSVRQKNEELTTAKELAEKAQRQAKQAKEEAVSAKEEAKKSITAFKTKTENMERHIADLERQLDEARLLASQAIDDFKASKTCEELLGNLVGPYMEGAFHNFRMQAITDFPQLENRFKQYKLDFDMLIQSCETDDE